MDQYIELIKQGGLAALCVGQAIALIMLWRHLSKKEKAHNKSQENSVERHRERDDKFEILQKESVTVMTKCSTLLQILINRGSGGNA